MKIIAFCQLFFMYSKAALHFIVNVTEKFSELIERLPAVLSLMIKEVDEMDHLIEQAIKGKHDAIIALIEQEEDVLYPIAFTYMKNEADALDIMQELTYKALKKMHTIKQPEYARTWLVRVLINCCKDHLKKRIHTEQVHENSAQVTPSYSDIERLLSQLTLNEQQLVYAKYFQQLKNNEIAEIHHIPEGTVKSKLHYILKKLRKAAGQKEDWL